jgi:RNA polymerase sigma-70 factor (ECF subfamily)
VAELDEALLARLRARDPEALRMAAEAHGRRIYRAARGMGHSATDAEDLAQEVFVTFLGSLDRFEGRAQIGTWLFGILHHKSLERRRAMSREELNDPIDQLFESQFDDHGRWRQPPLAADRLVHAGQVGAAIGGCLERLPGHQREVFHLRQVEELSAEAVSKITGQSITHIGVLLHRARARLRACLQEKGWGR